MRVYEELINHIEDYIALSSSDKELIRRCFSVKKCQPKEYLHEEGSVCKHHYFVLEGCLRMFFVDDKGNEVTTQFALEKWWMTDYNSLNTGAISEYFIQSLESTEVLCISNQDLESLLKAMPSLETYFRQMMQKVLAAHQYRIKLMHCLSKEDMVLSFYSSFGKFARRIPQYMVASYLFITPEYLSKVLKKSL